MKKIVLTLVAILSMTAVQAQNSDNNQARAPRRMTAADITERMTTELKLTDEQKTKVLNLNKEYEQVIGGGFGMRGPRAARPDGQGAAMQQAQQRPERPQMTEEQRAEMRQRFEKRNEYNEKLKAILTSEQFENYQKMQQPRGRRGGQGGPQGQGGRRGLRPTEQ